MIKSIGGDYVVMLDSQALRREVVFDLVICGILVTAMYMFFWNGGAEVHEPAVQLISSSEAIIKINEHQDAFILDVRFGYEFYERRIPGAVNIPYLMIISEQELLPRNKHTLIIVYCRTGVRAVSAAIELLTLGYTNIAIIFPGMDSWDYETTRG